MRNNIILFVLSNLLLSLMLSFSVQASQIENSGQVTIPITEYQKWMALEKGTQAMPAAGYAMGRGQANLSIGTNQDQHFARVTLTLPVQVLEQEWTNIPLLPVSAALIESSVDGQSIKLTQSANGYTWTTRKAGHFQLKLVYQVGLISDNQGWIAAIPLPHAAVKLTGNIPGMTSISIIPSITQSTDKSKRGDATWFSAEIPPSGGVQVVWTDNVTDDVIVSRANYRGVQKGDSIHWLAKLSVLTDNDKARKVKLLPTTAILSNVKIDDKPAPVITNGSYFTTLVEGKGEHLVEIAFQVPIQAKGEKPSLSFAIPKIPVSRFTLVLEGEKEIAVSPYAFVDTKVEENRSVATTNVPMTDHVNFSWVEAIPADIKDELRLNASLYHLVYAEEGVLYGEAIIDYEFTRGKTKTLVIDVPEKVQVNQVSAPNQIVSDWRMTDGKLTLFLSREIESDTRITIAFEKLLGPAGQAKPDISVPLLKVEDANRQRGMLALLSSQEIALKPLSAERVTKVGENQLPASVRHNIKRTIAHTYKYIDPKPTVVVNAVAPERKKGKFDAQLDTLFSIGDVTLNASSTIEINVKSGKIMELDLQLPGDVNVLGLTGPSLRTHQVKPNDKGQLIHIEFTQEMEGQFRLNVNYERILSDTESETIMPRLTVMDAEVEHGRLAIEALAAVEVQATTTDQLSSMDLKQLPQQLVLKTTNPILQAYRYVHVDPPYKLGLSITRHQELEVQVAAIEQASYQTLLTKDGLSVTTVRYQIRNSRKQFLRLQLPANSEVWSVVVGDKGEKPAKAKESDAILIKLINSSTGFPVEIVYATKLEALGDFGTIETTLPVPDMVATYTRWDLYLPEGPTYQTPDSNLDEIKTGYGFASVAIDKSAYENMANIQQTQMLRVTVPTKGVQLSFEKLYANKAEKSPYVHINYAPDYAKAVGIVISIAGVILLGIAIMLLIQQRDKRTAIASLVAGTLLVLVSIGYLKTPVIFPGVMVVIVLIALIVIAIRQKRLNA